MLTLAAAEEAGLIARETGTLQRELSMTPQDTVIYRTRVYAYRETGSSTPEPSSSRETAGNDVDTSNNGGCGDHCIRESGG